MFTLSPTLTTGQQLILDVKNTAHLGLDMPVGDQMLLRPSCLQHFSAYSQVLLSSHQQLMHCPNLTKGHLHWQPV